VVSLAVAEAAESAGAAAALDPDVDAAQAAIMGSNATAAARMREAGMTRLELGKSGRFPSVRAAGGPRYGQSLHCAAAMPCTGGD
jgi:hypothetical protein